MHWILPFQDLGVHSCLQAGFPFFVLHVALVTASLSHRALQANEQALCCCVACSRHLFVASPSSSACSAWPSQTRPQGNLCISLLFAFVQAKQNLQSFVLCAHWPLPAASFNMQLILLGWAPYSRQDHGKDKPPIVTFTVSLDLSQSRKGRTK